MTTDTHTKVLPALTDEVHNPRWGNRFQGPMPPTAGVLIDVLSNDQLHGQPAPVSVHLFRTDASVIPAGGNSDVRAKITYSGGNVSNEMYCDWNGQFSLVCSSLRIALETYAPQDGLAYAVPAPAPLMVFGALLGLGACPSGGQNPITYTSATYYAATGSFNSFSVPDFARRYFPIISSYINPNWEILPIDIPKILIEMTYFGTAYFTQCVALDSNVITKGLPVYGGVTKIRIFNGTPNTLNIAHHFQLGL